MPRTFNGTSDLIDFTALSVWDFGSLWYVGWTNDLAAVGQALNLRDGATNRILFGLNASEVPRLNIGGTSSLATTAVPLHAWYLSGVSKATGSQTPRFHTYDYSTNTWTHEAGSVALGDATTTSTNWRIGATSTGANFFDGSIAAVAVASQTILSDSEFENLPHNFNHWWVGVGSTLLVTSMWLFDQAATTMDVQDLAANLNNGYSATGTSVSTSSIGSPFSYGYRSQ